MFVVPKPGQKIPDPEQFGTPAYYLPPEGREVDASDYWHRRVLDGGVTVVEPSEPPAE